MLSFRKDLCASSFINMIHSVFSQIKDGKTKGIPLVDYLLSAFAVFSLKMPSLLQYDLKSKEHPEMRHNLKTLFKVNNIPSDTSMRRELDEVHPSLLRKAFTKIFSQVQRGKDLESYQYINGHYLFSIDATGYFSSKKVFCENCCVKQGKAENKTYYHQMLAGVIVHPDKQAVIPVCPEPIKKEDGAKKNDCELNASKRFLQEFKREHPHLPVIVVEDALYAKAPHLKLLESYNMKYIIGAKPGDHEYLFDYVKYSDKIEHEHTDEKGTHHRYEFVNNVPLNESNDDVLVNFVEYWEINKKGKKQHFSWVTNINLSANNIYKVMRGGRARWKVENETFNTLKNQGYNFEHNYGHGKRHLCTVLGYLMMLAFLIDQAQLLCCKIYQKAKKICGAFYSLWEDLRVFFRRMFLEGWDQLLCQIAMVIPVENTS